MHIAFLTPEYPHEKVQHAAGIGTSIKNLACELVNQGISVSIFVYAQKEAEIFHENGIRIHLIQYKKFKLFSWYFYRKHIQNYLNQYISSESIDIIEAPDWTGITAFMNLKAPLVIRFHGSDTYFCRLENRKQKLKNYWFERLGLAKAKAFIAPTDFAGELTKKLFKIKKQVQTIHNGVALNSFTNKNPESFERGLILYIGTIIRKKGVFELSEILQKVLFSDPEARLLLIGSDSFDIQTQSASTWELMTKNMDDSLKNKISYLGKVPYNQVQDYVKKANVFVFPTFAETQGMVTIEAMAMQKAVVNSNIGWANELLVDGESGFLVHPKDHDLFASRIVSILSDNDLADQLGKKARNYVESNFDIEKIVLQNIEFYKRHL